MLGPPVCFLPWCLALLVWGETSMGARVVLKTWQALSLVLAAG